MDKRENIRLGWRERLFIWLFCYPPPGRPQTSNNEGEDYSGEDNPLSIYDEVFGEDFFAEIRDKAVLDIGCGAGHEVLEVVRRGARIGIGVEARPLFGGALEAAERLGLKNRVKFSLDPVRTVGSGSVDIALSQNSFEHFREPQKILSDASHVLRAGGKFFITFSPPWLNPFGVHQFYMIRRPWAHFVFSERTIMGARRLYRTDGAMRYEDIDGGLNQMTVRKFLRFVRGSGLHLESLRLTPIRYTPKFLSRIPFIREFVKSRVSAVLVKR